MQPLKFITIPVIFMTSEEVEQAKLGVVEDDAGGESVQIKIEINSILGYWPDGEGKTTMCLLNGERYKVNMGLNVFRVFFEREVRDYNETITNQIKGFPVGCDECEMENEWQWLQNE